MRVKVKEYSRVIEIVRVNVSVPKNLPPYFYFRAPQTPGLDLKGPKQNVTVYCSEIY